MQLEKLKEDSLLHQYKVTLSNEDVANVTNHELEKIRAKAKIAGFRPGKVPLEIIKKNYEAQTKIKAIEDLVNKAIDGLIAENNWRLASNAKVDFDKDSKNPEDDTSFIINLELMPKIKFPDFTTVELEKMVIDITEQDIQKRQKFTLRSIDNFNTEVDGQAQEEDRVIIDLEILHKDQVLENFTKKDFRTIVSKDFVLEEFDIKLGEKLKAVKVGEELELSGKYKDSNSELNGKKLVAKIIVKKILRPQFTTVSEEFIDKIGYKSIDEFNAFIKDLIARECNNLINIINRVRLFDILENMLDFPVPASYLESEKQKLTQQLSTKNSSEEDLQKTDLDKITLRRLRIGMMLADYYAENKLRITNEDIVETILANYGQAAYNPDLVKLVSQAMNKNQELRASIINKAIENVATNNIFNTAKLVEKNYSYDQLIDELEKLETSNLIG